MNTLSVDAVNGTVTGNTRTGTNGRIVLEVRNINPFIHQYRIEGSRTTYAENAIADFAKLLGLSITVPASPVAASLSRAAIDAAAVGVPTGAAECVVFMPPPQMAEADVLAAALVEQHDATRSLRGEIKDGMEAVARELGGLTRGIAERQRNLENEKLSGDSIKILTVSFHDYMGRETAKLESRVPRLIDSITAYNGQVVELRTIANARADQYPGCRTFAKIHTTATQWLADTVIVRAAATQLAGQLGAAQQLNRTLDRAQANISDWVTLRRQYNGVGHWYRYQCPASATRARSVSPFSAAPSARTRSGARSRTPA